MLKRLEKDVAVSHVDSDRGFSRDLVGGQASTPYPVDSRIAELMTRFSVYSFGRRGQSYSTPESAYG